MAVVGALSSLSEALWTWEIEGGVKNEKERLGRRLMMKMQMTESFRPPKRKPVGTGPAERQALGQRK